MSLLMAMQLMLFNGGNIAVGVTTNERMNAQRYDYLKDSLPTLKGNMFDKGGFIANLSYLFRRGLVPTGLEVRYNKITSTEMDTSCAESSEAVSMACIPPLGSELDIYTGITQLFGLYAHPLQAAEAQRWTMERMRAIWSDKAIGADERDRRTEEFRDVLLMTMVQLCHQPINNQVKILELLNKGEKGEFSVGHINDQLMHAIASFKEEAAAMDRTVSILP